ncbi:MULTISPECIES: CZB domain-containing protein [Marivita]|uniref:CZB domain-containing protein n=1 Tax=Marivita cryptomonadis TaxID=505252 RepID=A0A9Q2NVY7_9RHOB|nr:MULTISPECIES: CZB domain-containing protein [Marivita]MCR9167052.1 CZB domain-containing protein [Paracoccaceae bacterium]MBM2319930.1 CZB domain-containing protein [Marivita cryptomonadis]MBM2329509.1 CZB domain-containing protein [Marivita cryptomonadis]MBM2339097.1 CZB domain-containing protein [Marivita cryptomonadis]MBM2343755.1 CZB domain-containing protein [Marivita cryptomonadis]
MAPTDLYTQLNEAIGAHGAWKLRLRMAAQKGTSSEMIETAGDCHVCDFGRWLDSLPSHVRAQPEARQTIDLHAAFHTCAGRVAKIAAQGQKDTALAMLDHEFNDASNALKNAVVKWKLAAN